MNMNLQEVIILRTNKIFEVINKDIILKENDNIINHTQIINELKKILIADKMKIININIKNLKLVLHTYNLTDKLIYEIIDIIIISNLFLLSNITYLSLVNCNKHVKNLLCLKLNENNILFMFKILLKSSELLRSHYNSIEPIILRLERDYLNLNLLSNYQSNIEKFIISLGNNNESQYGTIVQEYIVNQINVLSNDNTQIIKKVINNFHNDYINNISTNNHNTNNNINCNLDYKDEENIKDKIICEIESNIYDLLEYNKNLFTPL